jgi:hypothetical protein
MARGVPMARGVRCTRRPLREDLPTLGYQHLHISRSDETLLQQDVYVTVKQVGKDTSETASSEIPTGSLSEISRTSSAASSRKHMTRTAAWPPGSL